MFVKNIRGVAANSTVNAKLLYIKYVGTETKRICRITQIFFSKLLRNEYVDLVVPAY